MESGVRSDQLGESVWLIVVWGEHDISTLPDLQGALEVVRQHGTDVVIDFSEATFVDSTILRAVAHHHKKPGERVAIVAPPTTPPRRLFDLVGLASHLHVCDTRDEALRALGR